MKQLASDRNELIATLALSLVPGVGPQAMANLLAYFGTAANVLNCSAQELLQVPGLGRQLASGIQEASREQAEQELTTCEECDIEVLLAGDPRLPANLGTIPNAPPLLFVKGSILPRDALSIAIVGTRHATAYGKRIAKRLAASLARAGLTIVSGLARGIDAAAHEGALEAGGRTIAVLAGGLRNVYPAEHKELAFDVMQDGALVSEFPTSWPIQRGAFPRRNRIITGLSLGVIVVEAADRSGALISAQHAMEQGRDVFAVPGSVDSRVSRGCHELLRDGAILVESAEDVFEALGPLTEVIQRTTGEEIRHPAELQLNDQERKVLDAIESQPTAIDDICDAAELPIQRVLATISALETRQLIRRISGHQVARNF